MTWKNESRRHALASKGIKTGTKVPMSRAMQYEQKEVLPLAEQRANYEKFILESIDNDGYDNEKPLKTPKEKLQFLQDTFKSEYGFQIARTGEQDARAKWIMGLPSAIDLPSWNDDIIALAKKMGSLRKNSTEKQEQQVIDNYDQYMSNQIGRLNRKYKVE